MKFVYIDESGIGNEPVSVMAGVITDAYRMRKTKDEWNSLMKELSKIINKNINEIHTKDLYSGNSPWRNLNGSQRSEIIDTIFKFLDNRNHEIVYTAVLKEKFKEKFKEKESDGNNYLKEIGSLWRFMALHIALSLQKKYQGPPRGKRRNINSKGNFVLIFDREHREQEKYTNLLLSPPDWTDSYYDRKQEQEKMSQIIDVPHFVDSKQVGLIQLADFIAYFLRRYIELNMGFEKEKYSDEKQKINSWVKKIFDNSIAKNYIYLTKGRCDCANLFYDLAPDIIKNSKKLL